MPMAEDFERAAFQVSDDAYGRPAEFWARHNAEVRLRMRESDLAMLSAAVDTNLAAVVHFHGPELFAPISRTLPLNGEAALH
jgi:hypothetical protein